MSKQNIARRYGRAFFQIAREDGLSEEYYRQLRSFSELINSDLKLKTLLKNPVFDQDERRAVLEDILPRLGISKTVANFLFFLSEQKRIELVEEIAEIFRSLVDQEEGIVRASVKTAGDLSGEMRAALDECLSSLTGKRVVVSIEKDSSLLAGIVIRIGDTIYDGSLRKQLQLLQQELTSVNK